MNASFQSVAALLGPGASQEECASQEKSAAFQQEESATCHPSVFQSPGISLI